MVVMQSPANKSLLPLNKTDEAEQSLVDSDGQIKMFVDIADQVTRKLDKAINMAIISTVEIAMQKYVKQYDDEIWDYLDIDGIEQDINFITDDCVKDAFKEIRDRHGIEE